MGIGYWTRANSEACLLATRGKPKRLNADVSQVIMEPRREHSRKPDGIHERIERLIAGPYLNCSHGNVAPAGIAGATKPTSSARRPNDRRPARARPHLHADAGGQAGLRRPDPRHPWLLKMALRRFQLRCTNMREI